MSFLIFYEIWADKQTTSRSAPCINAGRHCSPHLTPPCSSWSPSPSPCARWWPPAPGTGRGTPSRTSSRSWPPCTRSPTSTSSPPRIPSLTGTAPGCSAPCPARGAWQGLWRGKEEWSQGQTITGTRYLRKLQMQKNWQTMKDFGKVWSDPWDPRQINRRWILFRCWEKEAFGDLTKLNKRGIWFPCWVNEAPIRWLWKLTFS